MAKAKKKSFQNAAMAKFDEIKKKVWPNTKKELEKGMKEAKKMLDKGETYLRNVSEKGVDQTKKISLNLKKEQLCYQLGKALAAAPKTQWSKNKKVEKLVKTIHGIDKDLKKIK